jgi:hypothetical protein
MNNEAVILTFHPVRYQHTFSLSFVSILISIINVTLAVIIVISFRSNGRKFFLFIITKLYYFYVMNN